MKHPRPVSLTPPAISTRTFAFVRKGYNPKEVRAYLAELESAIVQWTEAVDQPQLSPTEATIEGERILQAAQQQADALVQDAAARAVVIADDPASFFTGDRWEEVGEHARRVLQQAEHQAQNIVKMAEARATADLAAAAADRAEAAEVLQRARTEVGHLQVALDHMQEAQAVAARFLTARADEEMIDLSDSFVSDRAEPVRAPRSGDWRVPVTVETSTRQDRGRRLNRW